MAQAMPQPAHKLGIHLSALWQIQLDLADETQAMQRCANVGGARIGLLPNLDNSMVDTSGLQGAEPGYGLERLL